VTQELYSPGARPGRYWLIVGAAQEIAAVKVYGLSTALRDRRETGTEGDGRGRASGVRVTLRGCVQGPREESLLSLDYHDTTSATPPGDRCIPRVRTCWLVGR
jgi:hypothetical protein